MEILKLYLTSLEPDMDQLIYSQSIGGYFSNSLIYPETTISSTIGLYDDSLILDTPVSGSWSQWQDTEYINIGNEVIKVSPIINGNVSVIQRGYNNIVNMHLSSDVVRVSSIKELLNDVFNDDYRQYRCVAIKNISSVLDPSLASTAYDISVYLKQNSRNLNSSVRISLEVPSSQYATGISASWNTMSIVDPSLKDYGYSDNAFKEAYLKILSGEAAGQGRIISSFDSDTGTVTFYNSFSSSYDYSVNVRFEIYPAPSQRIKTGTISPSTDSSNVLAFFSPNESTPMRFSSFSDISNVFDISDLKPNDIMYIWIERTLQKGVESFDFNDIILNVKYNTS